MMRGLWKVEATDDDRFGDDVAVHGLQQFGLRGSRAETEFGVQRKEFERVMVIGSGSGSAHSGVAWFVQVIRALDRAIGPLRLNRNAFGKLARGAGNIEHHPVKNFDGGFVYGRVGIVLQQNEGDDAVGHRSEERRVGKECRP